MAPSHKPKRKSLLTYPKVIAHRAGGSLAPENTRAAFLKAKDLGVAGVEFDVMCTADEHLILSHDDELGRVVRGRGRVSQLPLAELLQLDAGSCFDQRFAGERMLALSEALKLAHEHNLWMNLEIKTHETEQVALNTVRLLGQYLPNVFNPMVVSSFSIPTLHVVREHYPMLPLAVLMEGIEQDWKEQCTQLNAQSVHVDDASINPDFIEQAHQNDLCVMVYTVNDPIRAKTLWEWGVDAVCTDRPDLLKNL